ncbi:MAG: hypothetical protein PF487_10885 [Bacteroidales bacterium]|jgi:hypothetical protein|nr:hypothetical protein [Bacteroidales bacterium]
MENENDFIIFERIFLLIFCALAIIYAVYLFVIRIKEANREYSQAIEKQNRKQVE